MMSKLRSCRRFLCAATFFLFCQTTICAISLNGIKNSVLNYLFEKVLIKKEDKAAQTAYDSLFDALEQNNSEAVKSLFSKESQNAAKDLDAGIAYLLSRCGGTAISIEKGEVTSSEGSFDHGKHSYRYYPKSTIKTGNGTYIIHCTIIENNFSEDACGILNLFTYRADEEFKAFFYQCQAKSPGIVKEADLLPSSYIQGMTHTLSNSFNEDAYGMFSSTVKSDALHAELNDTIDKFRYYLLDGFVPAVQIVSRETKGNYTIVKGTSTLQTETFEEIGSQQHNATCHTVYFTYKKPLSETKNNSESGFLSFTIVKDGVRPDASMLYKNGIRFCN